MKGRGRDLIERINQVFMDRKVYVDIKRKVLPLKIETVCTRNITGIFLCCSRKKPIRHEKTKLQAAMVVSLLLLARVSLSLL